MMDLEMKSTEEEYQEYRENMRNGNFLRQPYFEIKYEANKGLLHYPTIERIVGIDSCLEYLIPVEKMQNVLDKLNTLKKYIQYPINFCEIVPTAHDNKKYYFRDAKIIFFQGYNYIVPPMFFQTGANADGWCVFIDETV